MKTIRVRGLNADISIKAAQDAAAAALQSVATAASSAAAAATRALEARGYRDQAQDAADAAAEASTGFATVEATSLPPGASATAEVTGAAPSRELVLGIPRGLADDASMEAVRANAGSAFAQGLSASTGLALLAEKVAPTLGRSMLLSVATSPWTLVLRGHSLFYGQDTSATGTVAGANGSSTTRNPQRPAVSAGAALGFIAPGATVVDQGFPGDRAEDGWTRWSTAPVGDVLALFYETNEAVQGRTVAEYVQWMTKHIEDAQARGAAVILLGGGPTNISAQTRKIQSFTAATRALAARYGCAMLDVGQVLTRLPSGGNIHSAGDYLHYSTEAYAALGYAIAAMLGPMGAQPSKVGPGTTLYPQQGIGYAPGSYIVDRTTEESGGWVARLTGGAVYAIPIDVQVPCVPIVDFRASGDGNGVGDGGINYGLNNLGNPALPLSIPTHTNGKPHAVRGIPLLRPGIDVMYISLGSGSLEIERIRFAPLTALRTQNGKALTGNGLRRAQRSTIAGTSVRGPGGDWDARFDDTTPLGSATGASEVSFDVELGASGDNAVAIAAALNDTDTYLLNRGYSVSRQGTALQIREWGDAVANQTISGVFASATDPWRGRIRLSLSTTQLTVFVDEVAVGTATTTKWRHYVPGILASAGGFVKCAGATVRMPIL